MMKRTDAKKGLATPVSYTHLDKIKYLSAAPMLADAISVIYHEA